MYHARKLGKVEWIQRPWHPIDILAGGIYEALVTTVAGLIVGIVALFAYNYLVARINGVMNSLESKTMEFMDLLNEPAA